MYRTGGIVALVIGIALSLLWAFLPFTEDLRYRVSFEDGQAVWARARVECPDPWSVVVTGERPERGEYAMVGDECVRPARTLVTGAGLALAAGLWLGIYGLSRGRKPPPEPIAPLSVLIGAGPRELDSDRRS